MSEKMTTRKRAKDWLAQAKSDLDFIKSAFPAGHYSQICFLAQQSAEKAIKSIAFFQGYEVKGHSIVKIAAALNYNGEIERAAKLLDLYYTTTRYPDALPAGAPCDFFTKEQAEEAIKLAELIFRRADDALK